jgi:hypothetical protein
MRLSLAYVSRLVIALAATAQFSCVHADNGLAAKKHPAAADLCNENGNVKYAAQWADGKVTLRAQGTHNTGGYEVSLQQSDIEIFPPQFSLVHKRPLGIVTQAITPFNVSASFVAATKPASVIVYDSKGQQQVPVK